MARRKSRPKAHPHTGSDGRVRARLRLDGKDHYCGDWGTDEAKVEEERLIHDWMLRNLGKATVPRQASASTFAVFLEAYRLYADEEYVRDGKPTPERDHLRSVLRIAARLRGTVPLDQFTADDFEAIRREFPRQLKRDGVTHWSRGYCHEQAARLRRILRWGRRKKLVSAELLADVADVPPLKKGRTEAAERGVREPPTDADVDKTVAKLAPVLAAMVTTQRLCGMRPGEVCELKLSQLDRSGDCWLFEPIDHKTDEHGVRRRIWIGPRGQAVLLPWVEQAEASGKADAWIFPVHRWNGRGTGAYRVDSYQHAVKKACKAAKVPTWCPLLLRSARLTEVADRHGPLEAQATGSHTNLRTTAIYLRRQDELAQRAARESG